MKPITIPNAIVFAEVVSRLEQGKTVKLLLVGTSMTSCLRNGRDYVYLAPLAADEKVKKGDIVLFGYEDQYVLHRVVDIDGDNYVMQGDNCFTCERAPRTQIKARLVAVESVKGRKVSCDSFSWHFRSAMSLCRKFLRQFLAPFCRHTVRKKATPVYFLLLAILMWAPLNGLGVPLNNFIFGLRVDHFLHASVYLPCSFFLIDVMHRKKWRIWVGAILVGIITESVQYLLPFRGFDINDLLANFVGATLGFLIVRRFM